MAFERGIDGEARFGADVIAHLQSWNLDETADTVEGWSMGDQYSESFPTIRRWSGSFECYLDSADPTAAIEINDEAELRLYPGGDQTGKFYYTGTARISSVPKSGPKDGIVMLTLNFVGVGALQRVAIT